MKCRYRSARYCAGMWSRNYIRTTGRMYGLPVWKAICYLGGEEKRYIHVEVNTENWLDSLIWLTPKGVNLAEGDIEDMGVVIDE